jgi:hydrogenase/urease accessory protein HupE
MLPFHMDNLFFFIGIVLLSTGSRMDYVVWVESFHVFQCLIGIGLTVILWHQFLQMPGMETIVSVWVLKMGIVSLDHTPLLVGRSEMNV